jgi:hypothetical protein
VVRSGVLDFLFESKRRKELREKPLPEERRALMRRNVPYVERPQRRAP